MITSNANPQIKNLRQLQKNAKIRREQGVFPVEGVRMAREAPAGRLEAVYVSESFLRRADREGLPAGIPWERAERGTEEPRGSGSTEVPDYRREVLSDSVFDYVSDTRTPQGILCLVRMRAYRPEEVLARPDGPGAETGDASSVSAGLWVVLEGLQDPGNLGTIVRSGEGAGISGIIADAAVADLYNPKTIRSTMGSIYRVPFAVTEDLPATLADMRSRGIRLFAAAAEEDDEALARGEGGVSYTAPDYKGPTAFLIGNEGNGLSAAALGAAGERIRIPMRGRLESLNASTAAALLMYEADRQRRAQTGNIL